MSLPQEELIELRDLVGWCRVTERNTGPQVACQNCRVLEWIALHADDLLDMAKERSLVSSLLMDRLPIEILGLPGRVLNGLKRGGYVTVGDVVRSFGEDGCPNDLCAIRDFGLNSVRVVVLCLKDGKYIPGGFGLNGRWAKYFLPVNFEKKR